MTISLNEKKEHKRTTFSFCKSISNPTPYFTLKLRKWSGKWSNKQKIKALLQIGDALSTEFCTESLQKK